MKQLSFFESQEPEKKDIKKVNHTTTWHLYVDGASRGNPGPAGAGIVITKNNDPIFKKGFYLGKRTNNQAEYAALILGLLSLANHFKEDDNVIIISDSLLLVQQINKIYKVKNPDLHVLSQMVFELLQNISYTIKHVLREHNTQADTMANHGIDKKIAMPSTFLTLLKRYNISW